MNESQNISHCGGYGKYMACSYIRNKTTELSNLSRCHFRSHLDLDDSNDALRILIEFAIQEEHSLVKVRKSVNECESDNGFFFFQNTNLQLYSLSAMPEVYSCVCTHTAVCTHTQVLIRIYYRVRGSLARKVD